MSDYKSITDYKNDRDSKPNLSKGAFKSPFGSSYQRTGAFKSPFGSSYQRTGAFKSSPTKNAIDCTSTHCTPPTNSTIYFGSKLPDGTFDDQSTISKYYTGTSGFDCGNSTFFNVGDLKPGIIKSCGYKNEPPPDISKIIKCADENGNCSVPSDSMLYMWDSSNDKTKMVGRYIKEGGTTTCNPASFTGADPNPGKVKTCGYINYTTKSAKNIKPDCAEGDVCPHPLNSTIYYGSLLNGEFNDDTTISRYYFNPYPDTTPSFSGYFCNNATFFNELDPAPGSPKFCGYKNEPPYDPTKYVMCAGEGGLCKFPKDSMIYMHDVTGSPAFMVGRYKKDAGTVRCDTTLFNGADPSPGQHKFCGWISNTPPCGLHGTLVGGSACACTDGYSGQQCEIPPSTPLLNCGLHGTLNGSVCSCTDGYTGNTCNIAPIIPPVLNCGVHGILNGSVCSCKDGYTGNTCTVPPVTPPSSSLDCGSHGTVNGNTCVCKDNYTGSTCNVPPSNTPVTPPSSGGTSGTETGGTSGTETGGNTLNCGTHGILDGTTCVCKDNYKGSTCNIPPSTPPVTPPSTPSTTSDNNTRNIILIILGIFFFCILCSLSAAVVMYEKRKK